MIDLTFLFTAVLVGTVALVAGFEVRDIVRGIRFRRTVRRRLRA
jgi:hypothetical protein